MAFWVGRDRGEVPSNPNSPEQPGSQGTYFPNKSKPKAISVRIKLGCEKQRPKITRLTQDQTLSLFLHKSQDVSQQAWCVCSAAWNPQGPGFLPAHCSSNPKVMVTVLSSCSKMAAIGINVPGNTKHENTHTKTEEMGVKKSRPFFNY